MNSAGSDAWGIPPWEFNFVPEAHALPPHVNVAIVGGGFTGLAAVAWLRHCAPEKVVAVFERHLSPNATVLGGFAGQGVTLSVYLGRWAAEILLGQKQLPAWETKAGKGGATYSSRGTGWFTLEQD